MSYKFQKGDSMLSGSVDIAGRIMTVKGDRVEGAAVVNTFAVDKQGNVNVPQHNASNLGLKLAGTLVTSTAAELNLVDGSGAGSAVASKAVIYDAQKGVTAISLTGSHLKIGSTAVTSTGAEINLLDGSGAGSIVASKAVIYSTGSGVNAVALTASAGASLNSLVLGAVAVTSTGTEINLLDGSGAGSAVASKAVIYDAQKGITAISLTGSHFKLGGTSVTSTGAELNLVDGSSAGSAVASKAVIYDAQKGITATSLSGSHLTVSGTLASTCDDITFQSTHTTDPTVVIKNTTNDANGARLRFVKDKGAAGAANDVAGVIEFYADDANQDQVLFAQMQGQVAVHTNGQEGGRLVLQVASNDGELVPGIIIVDGDAEDEVDVSIGNTTTSVTSLAGNLKVGGNIIQASDGGSTITMDTDDNVTVAGLLTSAGVTSTGVTTVSGSLTSTCDDIVFQSTHTTDPLVIIKNTTNDANGARLRFVKDKGAAGAANDVAGIIEFYADDASQDQVLFAQMQAQVAVHTNGQEGGRLVFQVASNDGELTPGIILVDGDAEDEVDVTIGNTTTSLTSLAGNLKVGGNVIQASDGGTTITMDTDDNVTVAGLLTSAGVTSTGVTTVSGSLTSTCDDVIFQSTHTLDPLVVIKNTTNDANGPRLRFVKDKGAAGAANDVAGVIEFYADDASQDQVLFAQMQGQVAVHTNGQEGGRLVLQVASNDAELVPGIIIEDGDAEDEVDVSIGNTTTSVVTIAGDLKVTTDIILDDGGSLKEAGGTAAFTYDGSGNVTKIGQDSPSSGEFLKWDGSKAVWDSAGAKNVESYGAAPLGTTISASCDFALIKSGAVRAGPGGAIYTLPAPSAGKYLDVKLSGSQANVTLKALVGDAIEDGGSQSTILLEATGAAVTLVAYDNTHWFVT